MATVFSLAATTQALRLWEWRPGTPISLSGDAPQVLMQIQAILEHGWYARNPNVGAPFGLNAAWYSTADSLNFATIRAIGLFTDSAATAGAVFFILCFPLAALTAYWLARQLGLSRGAAVVVGVLFSVLPGHQEWFHHLWLAAYWTIPLATWLLVQVARGSSLWPRGADLRAPGDTRRRALTTAARTAAILLAIGLCDVYYVAFTLVLLTAVLVFRLATGTRVAGLAPGALAAAVIAGLCGLTLYLTTRGRDGDLVTGTLPAQRVIGESEVYSGKLIELVLPWHEHRVEPLRFLTYAYGVAATPSVERPALGVVALIGVAVLLGLALSRLAVARPVPPLHGLLAALTLVCLAFYTRAGLGSVVALFFTPQIRTWSRFVVFIGLLGFLAAGLWITTVRRRRGPVVAGALAGLVLVVGVLDQTNPASAPDYRAARAEVSELQRFTHSLASSLGPGCDVLQLPIVAFPEETPPGSMGDYDHLLPAINSPNRLRWSYGAIRGTANADWQLALPIRNEEALMEAAAAAGFCAVEVDRDGYAALADPSAAIERVAGAPIAQADKAHLAAYDLRPLRSRLASSLGESGLARRKNEVLRPVVVSLSGSLVDTSEGQPFQFTGPASSLTVSNMGDAAVSVSLSMEVEGVGSSSRSLALVGPGLPERNLELAPDRRQQVGLSLTVPPGKTVLTLSATGDPATVSGTEGKQVAVLKVSNLTAHALGSAVNAASLQQFAVATPPSTR